MSVEMEKMSPSPRPNLESTLVQELSGLKACRRNDRSVEMWSTLRLERNAGTTDRSLRAHREKMASAHCKVIVRRVALSLRALARAVVSVFSLVGEGDLAIFRVFFLFFTAFSCGWRYFAVSRPNWRNFAFISRIRGRTDSILLLDDQT